MIDMHCHILPGIDDGPATIEETMNMCRLAASDGISAIIATPHANADNYENVFAEAVAACDKINELVTSEGLALNIYPGVELAITSDMKQMLNADKISSGRGRYILAEFPFFSEPLNWEDFFIKLDKSGLRPLIAHPERNRWFIRNPDALNNIITKYRALVQITGMSITGELGSDIKEFSEYLLRKGLVHVIASDGHNSSHRPPVISPSLKKASEIIGKEAAHALVYSNPTAILQGMHPGDLPLIKQW